MLSLSLPDPYSRLPCTSSVLLNILVCFHFVLFKSDLSCFFPYRFWPRSKDMYDLRILAYTNDIKAFSRQVASTRLP